MIAPAHAAPGKEHADVCKALRFYKPPIAGGVGDRLLVLADSQREPIQQRPRITVVGVGNAHDAVGSQLGVAGDVIAGRHDGTAFGVGIRDGVTGQAGQFIECLLGIQEPQEDAKLLQGFLGNLQVQIPGGDDEHRRFGPELFSVAAIEDALVTDLERGPEEHGPSLAETCIPA